LWNNPGLTLTVLLTLALGIGANTAIFTVDYATLLAPLPYPQPDQLVVVWSKIQTFHNSMSAGDFTDWKRENTSFQDLNAFTGGAFNIASKDQPENINGRQVTPGFYKMFGRPFFLGRDFLPEEGIDGKSHVVILTHKLWSHLGADRKLVGQSMRINGEPYTVVGILSPGLDDRGDSQLAVPLVFKPEQLNHDFHWLLSIGRLKPGVTVQQAQANMDSVALHIAQENPKSNKGWGVFVEPLKNDFLPSERKQTLWLLLGAVAFILLIACVNVANMHLARAAGRQREMAVRASLGATRKRLVRQLLTESLVLALLGAAVGIGVAKLLLHLFKTSMPSEITRLIPGWQSMGINVRALGFTFVIALATGIIFGLTPALGASRPDLTDGLKEAGKNFLLGSRQRLHSMLVVFEVACVYRSRLGPANQRGSGEKRHRWKQEGANRVHVHQWI